MAYLVPMWMLAAAIGGGLAVLRIAGLLAVLSHAERLVIGFVLGIGLTGWLAFFAGIIGAFAAPAFAAILTLLCVGLILIRTPAKATHAAKSNALTWLLVAGIAAVVAMDFMEALAPAADADSMAYHFETPRLFLAARDIFAIPRAIDGATQLLLQLTYGVALGLGGKAAVPLWTMLSGWSLGALFYVLARRHAARNWALAGSLLLLSIPAVIYAAGTGQVEVRVAAFALLTAYAAAMSVQHAGERSLSFGWTVIAGLGAGFFIGAKLTGLIFATAAGITLIGRRATVSRMFVFSLAALAAGCQWYVFNWIHTGDPLYPLLWQHVTLKPGFEWDAGMAAAMEHMWRPDGAIPRSLLWFMSYPLSSSIMPHVEFGPLRTGLGPAVLLFAPFACIAAWQAPALGRSPLLRVMLCAVIFYTLWFFTTPTLLVRLLLPVYPLILLCVLVGLDRYTAALPRTEPVIWAGIASLMLIQIAGQAIFTKKYVEYLLSSQSDSAFLQRNISGYDATTWLNSHLKVSDRVLVTNREWLYLLDVPYFLAHPALQKRIDVRPGNKDFDGFVRDLTREKITHVIVQEDALMPDNGFTLGRFVYQLNLRGCAVEQARIDTTGIGSRTLPGLMTTPKVFVIFKVTPSRC